MNIPEDAPSTWPLPPTWETRMELLTPAFDLASMSHLGSESVGGRALSLSTSPRLSPTHLSVIPNFKVMKQIFVLKREMPALAHNFSFS